MLDGCGAIGQVMELSEASTLCQQCLSAGFKKLQRASILPTTTASQHAALWTVTSCTKHGQHSTAFAIHSRNTGRLQSTCLSTELPTTLVVGVVQFSKQTANGTRHGPMASSSNVFPTVAICSIFRGATTLTPFSQQQTMIRSFWNSVQRHNGLCTSCKVCLRATMAVLLSTTMCMLEISTLVSTCSSMR